MEFFDWLFNTREGVLWLFVGGFVVCAILALVFERSTAKRFHDHEPVEGEEEGGFFDNLFNLGGDDSEDSE